MTETEIAKEIVHKMIDNTELAEDAYPNLRKRLHDAVDEYEPNRSEKPNNCDTCKWGEWYRKGYDITMMSDECGGCCSWNSKWTPKTEPQTDCAWK